MTIRAQLRRACLTIVVLAAGACFTGPSAGSFTPAVSGHGVDAHLHLGRRRVEGELLELRDTGYVVINTLGVQIVPFSGVDAASFDGLGSLYGTPGSDWSERLRLASRFPHGMPDSALAQLLAVTHQSQMTYVR